MKVQLWATVEVEPDRFDTATAAMDAVRDTAIAALVDLGTVRVTAIGGQS